MLDAVKSLKDNAVQRIREYRTKHGVAPEERDEHLVAAIHLMNVHEIDHFAAQDCTSRGANDHGIDAWHYDASDGTLYIYQSKLTDSRPLAARGFEGLCEAHDWLQSALLDGTAEASPPNHAIFNLRAALATHGAQLTRISFRLTSPFSEGDLEEYPELAALQGRLKTSSLHKMLKSKSGKCLIEVTPFCFDKSIAAPTRYTVEMHGASPVSIRPSARLELVLISLASLVRLYRKRGDNLFEKNVRLSLNTKEARVRLGHPMEQTLEAICAGKSNPNLFPFYHVGVTISAVRVDRVPERNLELERPHVLNGCQTVTIADKFMRKLEEAKKAAELALFEQISVIAKIVVGTMDEETREITNSNNRQNPIESWQLFSNDPIHLEIESLLRDSGIFYERQKGRFEALMKRVENASVYHRTNNTCVSVPDLAQAVALCRRELPKAAKPIDIFSDKSSHDAVFDQRVLRSAQDIVWSANALRAVKRGLSNYLSTPAHDNEVSAAIFRKPAVKMMLYYAAIMGLYQKCDPADEEYAHRLNKIAPPGLVSRSEELYRKLVLKTKKWYMEESRGLKTEVASRKVEKFLVDTLADLGRQCPCQGVR